MKLEPLNNKGIKEMKKIPYPANSFAEAMKHSGSKIDVPTGKLLFHEKTIKSAVEWLKKEFHKKVYKCGSFEKCEYCLKIDKAFKDVIK